MKDKALEIREEIMFFAEAMERVMKKNDKEKGNSWKEIYIVIL